MTVHSHQNSTARGICGELLNAGKTFEHWCDLAVGHAGDHRCGDCCDVWNRTEPLVLEEFGPELHDGRWEGTCAECREMRAERDEPNVLIAGGISSQAGLASIRSGLSLDDGTMGEETGVEGPFGGVIECPVEWCVGYRLEHGGDGSPPEEWQHSDGEGTHVIDSAFLYRSRIASGADSWSLVIDGAETATSGSPTGIALQLESLAARIRVVMGAVR